MHSFLCQRSKRINNMPDWFIYDEKGKILRNPDSWGYRNFSRLLDISFFYWQMVSSNSCHCATDIQNYYSIYLLTRFKPLAKLLSLSNLIDKI